MGRITELIYSKDVVEIIIFTIITSVISSEYVDSLFSNKIIAKIFLINS